MTTKQCKTCEEHKPLEAFYNRKASKDGKYAECKKCHNARVAAREKERRATDADYRERWRAYNREYVRNRYATDADYRERQRDYAREYHKEHYENDPQRRQYLRDYYAQQVESGDYWVYDYTARCKKAGLSPVIERFTRQDVIEKFGGRCYYCDTGAFEHLDHYVPVSKGGPHALENVRPSCAKCNRAKTDSDPLVFAASSSAADGVVSE